MSLFMAIIIGTTIGTIGGFILQENFDLLVLNVCMGLVGAVLGDVIYYFASGNDYFLFTLGGAVSQAAGALLFVLIFSLLHKAAPDTDDRV